MSPALTNAISDPSGERAGSVKLGSGMMASAARADAMQNSTEITAQTRRRSITLMRRFLQINARGREAILHTVRLAKCATQGKVGGIRSMRVRECRPRRGRGV